MNAVTGAPPPGLVDKWAMRGVHQPNDAVVDADRHFGLQVSKFVLLTELFELRGGLGCFGWLREPGALRAGIGDVDPDEMILLFAPIASSVNAIHLHRLV